MYICIKLCKQLASEQSISSVLTNALAATDFLVANTNSLCLFMHNSECQHLNKNSGIPCHAFYLGSSQTTIYTQQLILIAANWWNAPKMQFIENIRSNMCQMVSFFLFLLFRIDSIVAIFLFHFFHLLGLWLNFKEDEYFNSYLKSFETNSKLIIEKNPLIPDKKNPTNNLTKYGSKRNNVPCEWYRRKWYFAWMHFILKHHN